MNEEKATRMWSAQGSSRPYSRAASFPERGRWLDEQGLTHLRALSPYAQWYQHSLPAWSWWRLGLLDWDGRRLEGLLPLPALELLRLRRSSNEEVSAWTWTDSCATCADKRWTSSVWECDLDWAGRTCVGLEGRGVTLLLATERGDATSINLSAKSAKCWMSIVSEQEANTTLTLLGNRCRNNSFSILSSKAESPSNCRIRRRSCEGFLSPSSSGMSSWCRRFCSDALVRLISSAFNLSYRSWAGGEMIKSLTSWAISGCSDEITWAFMEHYKLVAFVLWVS